MQERAPVAVQERAPVAVLERAPVAVQERAPVAVQECAPVAGQERAPDRRWVPGIWVLTFVLVTLGVVLFSSVAGCDGCLCGWCWLVVVWSMN